MFRFPEQALRIAVGVTITCGLLLVVLFRLCFIVRHVVDLKARTSYNALMLTDEQIGEQMPNLDIVKSFKKECLFFGA